MDIATTIPIGLVVERGDTGEAVYDRSRAYRYRLTRTWDRSRPDTCWVLLNPSTATACRDDPTISRVVGFSRTWGYGSAVVVNLFALRSQRPAGLVGSADPVGPLNDEVIRETLSHAGMVVVAWGNHGSMANPLTAASRDQEIRGLLSECEPLCLGVTVHGQPRHPLYLPASTTPVPLRWALNRHVARL